MRLLRIAGGALAGLLLLIVLAAWLAPRLLDWNQYRDAIASFASASLGRPVQIQGPVSLTLLPRPELTASNVILPNPGDGFSAGVAELRVQVALVPLLTGRLDAEDMTLHGARMRLPWPFRAGALQQDRPEWLTGLHARVEDGTLLIGSLSLTDIAGTLAADPLTGTFAVDGLAAGLGRRWRVTARLGRAGGDGSAPLELSLDGQDATQDTGGTFSGQLAPDGTLAGRVTGRGRDLSQLIAGPAAPWHAAGRFRGGDGLALADDLDVEIGGVPARGAVALRLLPQARLDAALATSRLDLSAWLPNLLRGGATAIPTSVDLSAEAVTLAGGTLRHTRLAFDLTKDGVALREAYAILPGDAPVNLTGRYAAGRFTGTGDIKAPDLRATLAWLQPNAPALIAAIPPIVMQTATLAATITIASGRLNLDGLHGVLDGAPLTGALSVTPGDHPELNGTLSLPGLNLDHWLPPLPTGLADWAAILAGWPGRAGGINGQLVVTATKPLWHGGTLDRLDLDAALQSGTLTIKRAALMAPDDTVSLAGTLAPGGRLTDARFDASLGHAAALVPMLPPNWPPNLFQGAAALHASLGGEPAALGATLHATMGDLRLDATGTADLVHQGWKGNIDFHHPGAPRLLEMAGIIGVAPWLGDGSLSLTTALTLDPQHIAASAFSLSAGELHATGDLKLERAAIPVLSGQIDAESLTLPLPYIRSPDPLPIDLLRGWQGQVGLKAAHVLVGLSPAMDHAAAGLALAGGTLRLTGLTAEIAGGKLTGALELAAESLPHLAAQATLAGVTLVGPLADGPIDVTSGHLDAAMSLTASGYSPGALLATLGGTATATLSAGTLSGLDLAGVDAALGLTDAEAVQKAVAAALQTGYTEFGKMSIDLAADRGAVTVRQGLLQADAGRVTLAGTLDLPINAADALFTLSSSRPGAPSVGLRVIGPPTTPRRTPELAVLAGWLASR